MAGTPPDSRGWGCDIEYTVYQVASIGFDLMVAKIKFYFQISQIFIISNFVTS